MSVSLLAVCPPQLTDDSDSCPCLVVDMESSTLTAGVHHAIEVYQMQVSTIHVQLVSFG